MSSDAVVVKYTNSNIDSRSVNSELYEIVALEQIYKFSQYIGGPNEINCDNYK